MKIRNIALAAMVAASGFTTLANAAKNEASTVYMFGFASSFNDSTVYITSVQQVDSAYITGKAKFLVSRENYSYQLRDYLEQQGAGHRTCAVFYALNQKKAEKKWGKLFDKYSKKPTPKKVKNGQKTDAAPTPWQVKQISNGDFSFQAIAPQEGQ